MNLPEKYQERMRELLGEEYHAYKNCLDEKSHMALRVNTNKISLEEWDKINPFSGDKVPWCDKGYYYGEEHNPAKHPYYFAGLYYIQEPSAMIPASLLPVNEGDRILDLCAAPGGKTTELIAKLGGTGELVANDISVSRAMALAKNVQIAGGDNVVVTAETPERLQERLPEYFDGILIDAPCSGEGMFRRDPGMVKDWEEHGPAYYVQIQEEILSQAYHMLKTGGYMVYSTCTFAPEEDEGMIASFLDKFSDMKIVPVSRKKGYQSGKPQWVAGLEDGQSLEECVRIFPHLSKGEGHFAVLMQKDAMDFQAPDKGNEQESNIELIQGKSKKKHKKISGKKDKRSREGDCSAKIIEKAQKWADLVEIEGALATRDLEKIQVTMPVAEKLQGLRFIQKGVILGGGKKRFEPSPQLALSLRHPETLPGISFDKDDVRVLKYLRGESIFLEEGDAVRGKELLPDTDQFLLISVEDFPLGFGKLTANGMIKNKYHSGWRMQ